jgi:hypothetical protein
VRGLADPARIGALRRVASGEIRHAIRFTVPQPATPMSGLPVTLPVAHWRNIHHMGQRFRLKADYDISGFSPQMQTILRAMKKYGMILADNGSAWYISGAPDERWDNDMLHEIDVLKGSNFEAVDVSSLMINADSGQVKQSNTTPQNERVYLPLVRR